METQQVSCLPGDEPIESFEEAGTPVAETPVQRDEPVDDLPECECGVQV